MGPDATGRRRRACSTSPSARIGATPVVDVGPAAGAVRRRPLGRRVERLDAAPGRRRTAARCDRSSSTGSGSPGRLRSHWRIANSSRRSLSAVSRRAMSRSRSRRSRRSIDHGPTRRLAYSTPPSRIGNQYWARRYDATPSVATRRVRPKPTSVGMYTPSTMPSPPGVIGMTAKMLARPNATSRASISSVPPNARRNTHSDAASSSQLRLAHSGHPLEQGAVGDQLLQPLADLAQRLGRRVGVEAQLAAEPAQEPLGPALAVLQAEHDEQGDDDHDRRARRGRPSRTAG